MQSLTYNRYKRTKQGNNPMTTFQQAFVPAVNKDGFSRLTFKGMDKKAGISPVKDKAGNETINPETGEVKTKEWVIINLTFEVMGRVKGTSQKVAVTVGERYSEENLLGKTLTAMGFVPPEVETVTDDEGFEVEILPEDEEGFGQVEDDDALGQSIDTFIEASLDKVYIGKVEKATDGKRKGYLQLDVETLKPLTK